MGDDAGGEVTHVYVLGVHQLAAKRKGTDALAVKLPRMAASHE